MVAYASPAGGCLGGIDASVVLLQSFVRNKRSDGKAGRKLRFHQGSDPLGVRLAERREVFDARKVLIFWRRGPFVTDRYY